MKEIIVNRDGQKDLKFNGRRWLVLLTGGWPGRSRPAGRR